MVVSPLSVNCFAQESSITSSAPFEQAIPPGPAVCNVVIRLVSEVNGISLIRGNCASRSALLIPIFAAATTSAPSVGSPLMPQRPSGSWIMWASDANVADCKSCFNPTDGSKGLSLRENCPCGVYPAPETSSVMPATYTLRIVISSLVSVPVLSEQITEVLPSVSTADRRRIRA